MKSLIIMTCPLCQMQYSYLAEENTTTAEVKCCPHCGGHDC